MPDAIDELQHDIANPSVTVVSLLHKAIPLASRLGDKDFVNWASQELKGYSKSDSAYDYRQLKGQYVVLRHDGGSIPIHWENGESDMKSRFITLPLAETESLLSGDCNTFAVKVNVDPTSFTSLELEPGDTIGFSIGRSTIIGFLNAIRQRLLEWTLAINNVNVPRISNEDKHPIASASSSQEEAIRRLSAQIDTLAQITDHDFPGWRHRTLGIIERLFGEDSRQVRTFRETKVARSLSQLHRAANDSSVDRRDILNTASLRSVLSSFIDEIRDFGLPSLPLPHSSETTVENEARVIAYLKNAYLQHPSQRPARVCPTIADIMLECRISKSQCYGIAAKLESLGHVEWVAKQAEGEFVRVSPSLLNVQISEPSKTTTPEYQMDVLISWSKPQSRELATALHRWIPKVLPGAIPWMSDKDIDKGTDWWLELKGLLARAKMCIICVTSENVRSPWLYFETGAIAVKGEGVRVCPYLVGIDPHMLADGPLSKWQCTAANKEDTLRMISSLNRALDLPKPHDEGLLAGNYEARWPELESELARIQARDTTGGADFVETEADQLAGKKLTSEARTLLVEAVKDVSGLVLWIRSDAGVFVHTNSHTFGQGGPRDQAAWRQAVADLRQQGLLETTDGKGDAFAVTDRGYKVAELLK
jgi:hypothetical protein